MTLSSKKASKRAQSQACMSDLHDERAKKANKPAWPGLEVPGRLFINTPGFQ
jgi:hypothetical protein